MNLKELEYIIKIAECGNLASAAEALYVTPSALSQHLGKIESDLGTPLFYRTRGNWKPTEAGTEYIDACRRILDIKAESYRRIRDISDIRKGSLRIGMPPERASFLIRGVYPQFHQEYPELALSFNETSVKNQQKLIDAGDLDLGFVTLTDRDRDDNEYILLAHEEIFLAVPTNDPRCNSAHATGRGSYPEMELKLFDGSPFALMYRGSTLRSVQDGIFSSHHIVPKVLFETAKNETAVDMVSEGICCGLVTNAYLKRNDNTFRYFSLSDHPKWSVCIIHKKGRYLSKAEKRFIELTKNFWRDLIGEK